MSDYTNIISYQSSFVVYFYFFGVDKILSGFSTNSLVINSVKNNPMKTIPILLFLGLEKIPKKHISVAFLCIYSM